MRDKRKASISLGGGLLAVRVEVRYQLVAGRRVRFQRLKVVRSYVR